jgi:hypothetical protein
LSPFGVVRVSAFFPMFPAIVIVFILHFPFH